MSTILIAGTLSQPFGSFPVVSTSSDGVLWSPMSSPFANGDHCTAIATDGTTVAVSNARGIVSVTTDTMTFNQTTVEDGFGILDLQYGDNIWIAVGSQNYVKGYGPYPPESEVAQIYTSTSASGPWSMVWTHSDVNSRFYQIRYFSSAPIDETRTSIPVLVTVGNKNGTIGNIWYSLDHGVSWVEAVIPNNVGTIYSVQLYQNSWYWGASGKIYKSSTLYSSIWEELYIEPTDTVVNMVTDPTQSNNMIANGKNSIYVTSNGSNFRSWSYAGYVFDQVGMLPLTSSIVWLAFVRSTLTQYTMWYSTDLINWTPTNNSIHVQGCALKG